MCKENLHAKMEKVEAQICTVDVQDKSIVGVRLLSQKLGLVVLQSSYCVSVLLVLKLKLQ